GQPAPPPAGAQPPPPGVQPPPPQPRYGEYAPPGYVPPAAPPVAAAPAGRRRRTWDVTLTIVLLVLGLFGVLAGLALGAVYTDAELLDAGFEQQGLGSFDGEVGGAYAIIAVSHIALYLAAVGVAVPLLVTKRIAFWVPLVAGVVAAIVFWATVASV